MRSARIDGWVDADNRLHDGPPSSISGVKLLRVVYSDPDYPKLDRKSALPITSRFKSLDDIAEHLDEIVAMDAKRYPRVP